MAMTKPSMPSKAGLSTAAHAFRRSCFRERGDGRDKKSSTDLEPNGEASEQNSFLEKTATSRV